MSTSLKLKESGNSVLRLQSSLPTAWILYNLAKSWDFVLVKYILHAYINLS